MHELKGKIGVVKKSLDRIVSRNRYHSGLKRKKNLQWIRQKGSCWSVRVRVSKKSGVNTLVRTQNQDKGMWESMSEFWQALVVRMFQSLYHRCFCSQLNLLSRQNLSAFEGHLQSGEFVSNLENGKIEFFLKIYHFWLVVERHNCKNCFIINWHDDRGSFLGQSWISKVFARIVL